MTMRLQEVHPMLTHGAVVALPTAIGVDVAARITDSDQLYRLGRALMPIATTTAAVTAATGLVAEQTVDVEGRGAEMLSLHRTINLGLGGVATAMSGYRMMRRRPGWGYLSLGLAAIGAMTYSAYLGGNMVYAEGVGVEAAGGLQTKKSPKLKPENAGEVLRTVGRHLKAGIKSIFTRIRDVADTDIGPDEDYVSRRLTEDNRHEGSIPIASRGPGR